LNCTKIIRTAKGQGTVQLFDSGDVLKANQALQCVSNLRNLRIVERKNKDKLQIGM